MISLSLKKRDALTFKEKCHFNMRSVAAFVFLSVVTLSNFMHFKHVGEGERESERAKHLSGNVSTT